MKSRCRRGNIEICMAELERQINVCARVCLFARLRTRRLSALMTGSADLPTAPRRARARRPGAWAKQTANSWKARVFDKDRNDSPMRRQIMTCLTHAQALIETKAACHKFYARANGREK
jgi:hypothetical protein